MALSPYSLMSLDELKSSLSISGNSRDDALEAILNRVTDEIEDFLDRQLVTRGSLTEYHTMSACGADVYSSGLRTRDWPILTVTSIHEDTALPRTYGAAALLVVGTHYEIIKDARPRSLIRRLNGGAGLLWDWATGHRAIKIVYTAGYAADAVPERIKAQALRYASILWEEQKRGGYGMSGQTDALGNFTRFAMPQLSPEMKSALTNDRRNSFWESGERDA